MTVPMPPARRPAAPHARLLERAHHVVPEPPPGNTLTDLEAGLLPDEIAERRGFPLASVLGVRSFYDQLERVTRVCEGTACRFHGADVVRDRLARIGPVGTVKCLGHCHSAPAFRSGDNVYACPRDERPEDWVEEWGEGPSPMVDLAPVPRLVLAPEAVLLRHLADPAGGPVPPRTDALAGYVLPDGDTILAAVEDADLRSRAGSPERAAASWRLARATAADERYVVANGDEGDPGAYVDRLLLEEDPHAVLAGMVACARAIGARRGFVFIRGEYPLAPHRVRAAIAEARARGLLGIGFDVDVLVGAGAYVSGDANALLRSIEGLRGEPAPEPPTAAERGLWGKPTVVQHAETFALVPWAVRHRRPMQTRTVCISGAVARPCVAEIPQGMPLREVLTRAAGGPRDATPWRMALLGGPTGRVLPERLFDTPLDDDTLPGLGHGGIVVLDEHVSPRALAQHLFAFAASESCGACAPCRAGCAQLPFVRDLPTLERLLETLATGSLCRFGQRVPRPIRDLIRHCGEGVLR